MKKNMEKAIKKAIEGGYQIKNAWGNSIVDSNLYQIMLDHLFWQSLGKACGWIEKMPSIYSFADDIPEWQHHWHDFIFWLSIGKNPDDFFTNLLTPKQG